MNTNPTTAPSSRARPRVSSPPAPARIELKTFGASDRGQVRPSNQDRFLVAPLFERGGCLFAVADGVGGTHGGETASTLTTEVLAQVTVPALQRLGDAPDRTAVLDTLRAAFGDADARVDEERARHPDLRHMATTLTLACVFGRTVYVGHVGDSRCYLLRGGLLRRLTSDQTVAAELVRRGFITSSDAVSSRFRHVLTDFVGGGASKLHVEMHDMDLVDGDVLLLCSDGLTGMVTGPEIAAIVRAAESPEAACRHLIERANVLGGYDNVTAVIARCDAVRAA